MKGKDLTRCINHAAVTAAVLPTNKGVSRWSNSRLRQNNFCIVGIAAGQHNALCCSVFKRPIARIIGEVVHAVLLPMELQVCIMISSLAKDIRDFRSVFQHLIPTSISIGAGSVLKCSVFRGLADIRCVIGITIRPDRAAFPVARMIDIVKGA